MSHHDIDVAYSGRPSARPLPKDTLPARGLEAESAYRFVHDELLLDGSSRLNLATFVTTWMEPQADRLMAESFDKNMIDKDEYPQTAELERRCVSMVGNLFHSPGEPVGVSTIGSSEAVMLAGLALKWRWRTARKIAPTDAQKPNLVLGANVQVVWEKFCRYWDVEPRYIPMTPGRYTINAEEVMARVDDDTIGVVAILGTTFTGVYEPIEAIHDALAAYNATAAVPVPLHVDAASGGFVAPFLQPDLAWDFRLPWVRSINVSGHKYGLTYPGIGFAAWRDAEDLPEDLVFHVNYLGGDMPTFTLNFSRPGNQVVGQYYNFIRLGHEGYHTIMSTLQGIAADLARRIGTLPEFELVSDATDTPVFAFSVTPDAPFDAFELSDRLRKYGWQVPAYTMPENAQDIAVLRIVVREGFSADLADLLMKNLDEARHDLAEGDGTARGHFAHT